MRSLGRCDELNPECFPLIFRSISARNTLTLFIFILFSANNCRHSVVSQKSAEHFQ